MRPRALYYQTGHVREYLYLLIFCGKRDWSFQIAKEDRARLTRANYGAVYPCVQNILLESRTSGSEATLIDMHQAFKDKLHQYFNIPYEYSLVVTIPMGRAVWTGFPPPHKRYVTFRDRLGDLINHEFNDPI